MQRTDCMFATYKSNVCKLYNKLAAVYLIPNDQSLFFAKYSDK